jgi:mRNA interferase RelE/StbE
VARRILAAITRIAEIARGDVARLHGSDNEFRLRVGDWRVRFLMRGPNNLIEVVRILPRGRAYRD